MRSTGLRTAAALLLAIAAACGGDSTTASSPPPASPQDGLWTASGAPSAILRLDSMAVSDTGVLDPVTTITTTSAWLYPRVAVAFDAAGNLWVASQNDSLLLAFAPGDLAGSGSRAAARVISSVGGSLSAPTGLAFDAGHRLWVVNAHSATVVRFDPAQLAAGGAQVPAVVLSLPGTPATIAFDAAGALWVGDPEFHTIAKFAPSQLEASGSPPPVFRLTAADSLQNPGGMAFDAAGNLWVANTGRHNLLAFSPAQLAGTGSAGPPIIIGSNGGSLNNPVGVAFDVEGDLWVVGRTGALARLAGTSLRATGSPAPSASLQISGHSLFWSLAFWPRPPGLPFD
jgi:sugar lactone lactonase YvrE